MATRKVTVTLHESDLARIREIVASGAASSVSGFVQHAVRISLDDVAGWAMMLAQALEETGGPITEAERAWADDVLRAGTSATASAPAA
ncbi:MAG TPA: hypothetical protein VIP75_10935 [Acidothermales bacterium]